MRRPAHSLECLQPLCDSTTGIKQIGNESLVDIQIPFVFSLVAHLVTLRKDAPHLRAKTQGSWEQLKDDVTVRGSVAMPSQSRQAQRMRRVIAEIEATLYRKGRLLGIR